MTASGATPRRIARIIARLNIGGPAIQAVSLSRHLQSFGYETLLMFGQLAPGEGDMRYLLTPDVARQEVPTLGRAVAPLHDLRAWWRIYRVLRAFRPDIVHTHTAKAGALGRLAALAYNATRGKRRARLVHTYHGHVLEGYFNKTSTAIFAAIERWLARRTDVLIAISSRVRHDLCETYRIASDAKIRLVPLGFDLKPFAAIDDEARVRARAVLGISSGRHVVTTVGRLTEIKQPHLFLEMAARVASRDPDVEFLIVGDGDLRPRLEALARARGIDTRVSFLGWRTDLTTIYGATDVFVLTSRNEGTPVALIEAMASAVPGVSTDVGGVRDVIINDEVGRLVSTDAPEPIAEAVTDLLASAPRRRAMGVRAREAVLPRFQLERLLADMAALYDGLLAGGSQNPV